MRHVVVLFSIALLVACGVESGGSEGGETATGITGRVLFGPTCPVEIQGSPCPDRPIAATVRVLSGDETVASVRSGEDGRFRVELDPGTYTLVAEAETAGVGGAKPVEVEVAEGLFVAVTLFVDSGIR